MGCVARPSREALALNRALHESRTVDGALDLALGSLRGGPVGESLSMHNAAAAMHRVAKLSAEGRGAGQGGTSRVAELMDVTQGLVERGEGVEPRHLSMILWSLGKLAHVGTCEAGELQGLARAVTRALVTVAYRLGDIECSNALWGLARLPSPGGEASQFGATLATKLVARAVQVVPGMRGTQGVANIAWAAATLEAFAGPGRALFAAVAARAVADAVACAPQELSNLCWALAKGGGASEKTTAALMALGEECGKRGDSGLSTQHRATVAWALAKACVPSVPQSLGWIFGRGDADAFTPAELAMGCWAGAQWRLHATRHAVDVTPLLESARRRTRELSASELASLLWSEAHLRSEADVPGDGSDKPGGGLGADNLVAACARALDRHGAERCAFGGRTANWGPQDLANASWACARLCSWFCEGGGAAQLRGQDAEGASEFWHRAVDQLLSLLASETERRITSAPSAFLPQHLSSILWGVAKSVSVAPGGSVLLEGRAKWSRLMTCIATQCEARIAEFSPRDLSDAMWAFSMLLPGAAAPPSCVSAMGAQAAATLDKFNSQSLLKFLGAFERCGGVNDSLASKVAGQRELCFTFPALGGSRGEGGGLEISLLSQAPGRRFEGTGVALWEASFVLAEWLSRNPDPRKAVRALRRGTSSAPAQRRKPRFSHVVELGAGLGLPSLLVARAGMVAEGGRVTSTDWDADVLQILGENACRNGVQDVVHVERLAWGETHTLAPDLVLACDCIYGNDQAVWRALIDTIVALSAGEGDGRDKPPLILVANVRRYPSDDPRGENAFFRMLHHAGLRTLAEVPLAWLHPDHRRAGSGGTALHALVYDPGDGADGARPRKPKRHKARK